MPSPAPGEWLDEDLLAEQILARDGHALDLFASPELNPFCDAGTLIVLGATSSNPQAQR